MTRSAPFYLLLFVTGLLAFAAPISLHAQQGGGLAGMEVIIEENDRLNRENDQLKQNFERVQRELEALRGQVPAGSSGPTKADLDAAVARAAALTKELEAAREALAEHAAETDELRSDLETARQQLEVLQTKLDAAEQALADAQRATETAEANLERLRAQAAEANRQLDAALQRNAELEAERDNLQRRLDNAGGAIERVAELEQLLQAERRRAADLERRLAAAQGVLEERLANMKDALDAAQARGDAEATRADRAESEARQCVAERQNCPMLPECDDTVTVVWDAPGIARMTVDNPCRGDDILRVRSSNIRDPLLRTLKGRFDSQGRAELTFPVVTSEVRLHVAGTEPGSFTDVIIKPPVPLGDAYAILTWENAVSDLDLLVSRDISSVRKSTDSGFDLQDTGIGEKTLAQDAGTAQQPRFEVIVMDSALVGSLDLGVAHALRGPVAITPFCGDASAATPGFRLYFQTPNEQQQVVTGEVPEVACGELVPPDKQFYFLRRVRF